MAGLQIGLCLRVHSSLTGLLQGIGSHMGRACESATVASPTPRHTTATAASCSGVWRRRRIAHSSSTTAGSVMICAVQCSGSAPDSQTK